MQIASRFLSFIILASSIVPSVFATDYPTYKTKTVYKTNTEYVTVWKKTTIIKYKPTTVVKIMTPNKPKCPIPKIKTSIVTETETISKCDVDPTPTVTEVEEDPFSTCPPSVTITATRSCDPNKPPCPDKNRCAVDQPLVGYHCNCVGAPTRTETVIPSCPEDCCDVWVPTRYHLFKKIDGKGCATPEPTKPSPIILDDE
ncbi:uncharacterized protein DFL_008017 [Arthrobotrys flagrans]|uniref:EGF-like domain-containing protein n=1 Tax=Arthrobotrys flagrans TaxID=97331 RepID=A0A436ZMJ3_ARTFL|nr:hypothetical protein DFL_008017 [Arthrobotrys flagrans]